MLNEDKSRQSFKPETDYIDKPDITNNDTSDYDNDDDDDTDEFFSTRPGTTNLGTDYENLNVAHFALKLATNKTVRSFKISSNDEKYGDFDDIVVNVKSGNLDEVLAFQLKHISKGTLPLKELEKTKGNFSIKKYFLSFKEVKGKCDKFILYTNLKFNADDTTRLQIDGENFKVGVRKITLDGVFKIFSATEHCYQFYVDDDSSTSNNGVEVEEYKEFFEKFYLFTNQGNANQTKRRVCDDFKHFFGATQIHANSFTQFIANWTKSGNTKEKLNKKWIKSVILLQLLSSKIKSLDFNTSAKNEEKIQVLKTAFSIFNVIHLQNESYEKCKNMWSATKSEISDLKNIRNLVKKYQLDQKSLDELENETLNKIFWLQGKCPLLIEADADLIYNVIKLCPDRNYILLGHQVKIDKLPKKITILKNLSDAETHTDLFSKLTKILTCSIQGKSEISLHELCKEFKTLPEMIESDDLVEMLNGPLNLGGEKEGFSFPYVPRYLLRQVVDINYLGKIENKTVVIIDNVKNIESLKSNFSRHNFVKFGTQNDSFSTNSDSKSLIYFSENECCAQDFETISQKSEKTKIYHHFRWLNDNCLEWIRSKGDINQLQNHKLTNLSSQILQKIIHNLDNVQSKDYVNDLLNKLSVDRLKETILWSQRPQNNINLIVGEPGMGKSELMKSLKNQTPANIWTIVIDPNDIFSFFQTSEDPAFSTFIIAEKVKHLSPRDKQIFEMFAKQGNVTFVWDALDEIATEKVETVADIILEFSNKSWAQWVTARCHLQRSLELKFNVLSRNLTQFDRKEQKNYIRDRLRDVISVDKLENIIEEMQSCVVLVEKNNILGVPLLLYMMTELIKNDTKLDLFSGGFLLNNLYHHFLEQKFELFYTEKLGYSLTNFNSKLLFDKWKKQQMITHTKFALNLLLPLEISKQLNTDYEDDFTEEVLIGLIVDNHTKIPSFSHMSFAEYLVALYLSNNVDKTDFFKSFLFDEKYNNVRFFFDLLCAKDSPPHVAVLYKNLHSLQTCKFDITTCKDKHGRNLLHLVCSWGQRHPHFNVENVNGAYIVDHDYRFSTSAESVGYLEMLDFVLTKCNCHEFDDLFGMTPLDYAQETATLVAEIKLRKIQGNNRSNLNVHYVSNIFYYSANFGYMEAFELLIDDYKHLVNLKNIGNWTLLLVAIDNKCFDIGKFLLSFGADVHAATTEGYGSLVIACWDGNNEIIKDLLRHGADVNQANKDGVSALFFACQRGHNQTVRLLLENGANINTPINDGRTPLFLVCGMGQNQTVRLLLESGAHINQPQEDGGTPLYIACQNGQVETVRLLLASGASINQPLKDGASPLSIACQKGRVETVRFLLRSGADINQPNKDGVSPLFIVCQTGQNEIARLLLEGGADVNQPQKDDASPLYVACETGRNETVRLLLANGADVNQPQIDGASPLYVACDKGHVETASLLLENGAGINQANKNGAFPLFIASQKGRTETVRHLLKEGADLNQLQKNGASSLYVACETGQNETVRLLLEKGADINQACKDGVTPLFIACQMGHHETARLLLEAGADINQPQKDGASPLFFACQEGKNETVSLLLKSGADINQPQKDGASPLFIAGANGRSETARLLLESGADINQPEKNGASPLFFACQVGQKDIVRLLLRSGANINQATKNGASPLFVACEMGQKDIVHLLLESEVDINQTNNDDASPLYIACQHGHIEIVRFLLENGADVNQGMIRATPHYIPFGMEQNKTPDLIPKHGTDLYKTYDDSASPLHVASKMGQNEIVRLLLEKGADINQGMKDGVTPLYVACQEGQNETVSLLLQSGAEINQATIYGTTPLWIANIKGHSGVVEILQAYGSKQVLKNSKK